MWGKIEINCDTLRIHASVVSTIAEERPDGLIDEVMLITEWQGLVVRVPSAGAGNEACP